MTLPMWWQVTLLLLFMIVVLFANEPTLFVSFGAAFAAVRVCEREKDEEDEEGACPVSTLYHDRPHTGVNEALY